MDITLNTTTLATATMSAGTIFTTSVDGTDYQFVTDSDVTASNIGSGITFNDVFIYEGTYVTTRYTVDSSDVDQRFLLRSNRADTSTLTVKVQNSLTDTITNTYSEAKIETKVSIELGVGIKLRIKIPIKINIAIFPAFNKEMKIASILTINGNYPTKIGFDRAFSFCTIYERSK